MREHNLLLRYSGKGDNTKFMINKDLLDILVCPNCKGEIELDRVKNYLFCEACNLTYEIKNNIPVMIVEKAKPLTL